MKFKLEIFWNLGHKKADAGDYLQDAPEWIIETSCRHYSFSVHEATGAGEWTKCLGLP